MIRLSVEECFGVSTERERGKCAKFYCTRVKIGLCLVNSIMKFNKFYFEEKLLDLD